MSNPRLKKQAKVQTLTCEVHDLVDMDAASRAEMAADPAAFFRKLLKSEGAVVNGLIIDEKLRAAPAEEGQPVPQVYHCVSPDSVKSKYITIVL
ncbi:MAG TPA: hypothetical protein VNX66_02470 [Candidatus Sulfotelmatobacter sp.]|jgi:hypothetical protein|nr:hypothetical protein [Candidatus Sulfotelmatobacter sp.]